MEHYNQDNWALCGKIDEIVYTWADVLNTFAPLLGQDLSDEEKGSKL